MPNDAAAAADDGIDANVIVAIDIADADADADAACAQCDRPNCAGGDAHQANAVYLGCRRCGLELNDVRPLFFRPAAERSSTTCELCGLRYRTGHYVRLHFLSHFNELTSATRPLLCVQCAEDAEAAERQQPSKTGDGDGPTPADGDDDDDDDMQDVEMLAYECDECDTDELFNTEKALNEHRFTAHGIEMIFDDDYVEAEEPEPKAVAVSSDPASAVAPGAAAAAVASSFCCTKCQQRFETANQLEYHQAKTHRKKRRQRRQKQPQQPAEFRCRLCVDDAAGFGVDEVDEVVESFASVRLLRQHMNVRHRNADTGQFDCDHCDRTFACGSFLALHRLRHTGVRRFACDQCDERFGRLAHLKYHQASRHTEQRTFGCAECGPAKVFKTAASLQRHRQHMHPAGRAERRRYPCELCEKVFPDSSDLRRHRWSHGGFERKYGCELCEKRFHEPKGLRKHRLAHVRRGELMDVVQVAAEEECVAS